MVEWLTGVGAYQRSYAGKYIAMVWLDDDLVTWRWAVVTFDREAGSGTADTDEVAKDTAMRVLMNVAEKNT
ncbi:hypothetical protein [Roseomonas genomospecies 6]|nr:hypothetical protein [Roseomonas genomospecies 6]